MTMQELEEKRQKGATLQEKINGTAAITKQFLIDCVMEQVGHYPQYTREMFADWKVGMVREPVKTKMGEAFRPGDVTLVKEEWVLNRFKRNAWSFRNRINTSLGDL